MNLLKTTFVYANEPKLNPPLPDAFLGHGYLMTLVEAVTNFTTVQDAFCLELETRQPNCVDYRLYIYY